MREENRQENESDESCVSHGWCEKGSDINDEDCVSKISARMLEKMSMKTIWIFCVYIKAFTIKDVLNCAGSMQWKHSTDDELQSFKDHHEFVLSSTIGSYVC